MIFVHSLFAFDRFAFATNKEVFAMATSVRLLLICALPLFSGWVFAQGPQYPGQYPPFTPSQNGPALNRPGNSVPGNGAPGNGAPSYGAPSNYGAPGYPPPGIQPPGVGGPATPDVAPKAEVVPGMIIRNVFIKGNRQVSKNRLRGYLKTRPGREFDPEILEGDVRALATSSLVRNVKILTDVVDGEVVVTFQVVEASTVQTIAFIGNRQISDRALLKQSGLKVGAPLDLYRVRDARQKIVDFYLERGYTQAEVEITEGLDDGDNTVVFSIAEGPWQRVLWTSFTGNTIASDGRLKTLIESKPGFLWYFFKGQIDYSVLDSDIAKLTAYYRSLGFYRATIGRELTVSDSGNWVSVNFIINEGPRYKIRNVSIVGNRKFKTETLMEFLELNSGEYFNMEEMQKDVATLTDIYGAQGHVYANVTPERRFLEEPGELDLVFTIEEGAQWRVGRVNVHIAGDYPHTQQNVIRNRIDLRPGDIIDVRKIRSSERILKSSQLFLVEPQRGISPYIKVEPLDEKRAREALARETGSDSSFRGQTPTGDPIVYVDISVSLTPKALTPPKPGLQRLPPVEDQQ